MAAIAGPAVTTGIQQTIHKRFKIMRSATLPMKEKNLLSGLKMLFIANCLFSSVFRNCSVLSQLQFFLIAIYAMIVISIANSMLKSKEKGGMKVLKKYNQKTVRQSDHERMKKLVKMP